MMMGLKSGINSTRYQEYDFIFITHSHTFAVYAKEKIEDKHHT
jgi:hypothetical protein